MDQGHLPDLLDLVRTGAFEHFVEHPSTCSAVGACELDLDQLVVMEGAFHLGDHGVGQAGGAGSDHRLQAVSFTAQITDFISGQGHGSFGVGMQDSRQRGTLSRRGIVRVDAGPLREVKVELGVVLLLIVGVVFFTIGWDGPPWIEVLILFGASTAGAGWIAVRARQVAARARMASRRTVDSEDA